jgi:uridine kinase
LGPNGACRYQRAVSDHRTEAALSPPVATAPADAVLVFDGVFLLRPELVDRWELRIFLAVELERTVERAKTRDQAVFGSAADVERRWRRRYIPAQELYFATARPTQRADIVVHNDEPESPAWEARRR